MRTLILAGSFGEAARYARGKGLRHYRYAASAEAVANFQAQRVVELPGYARRADKHALNAIANRITRRGGEWVQDEYVPEPEPIDESALGVLSRMTREDWLMAGATPAQADELTPELTDKQRAEVDRVNRQKDGKYDAIVAMSELGEDPSDSAVPLENKGSGRPQDKVPSATKPRRQRKPRVVNKPDDDPFEA